MTPVKLLSSRCTVRRLCYFAKPGAPSRCQSANIFANFLSLFRQVQWLEELRELRVLRGEGPLHRAQDYVWVMVGGGGSSASPIFLLREEILKVLAC